MKKNHVKKALLATTAAAMFAVLPVPSLQLSSDAVQLVSAASTEPVKEEQKAISLKDLQSGDKVKFANVQYIVLNPKTGYIAMEKTIKKDVFFRDYYLSSQEVEVEFNSKKEQSIAHYLNNNFYAAFSASQEKAIQTHKWSIGSYLAIGGTRKVKNLSVKEIKNAEDKVKVSAKIGLLSLSDWMTYSKKFGGAKSTLTTVATNRGEWLITQVDKNRYTWYVEPDGNADYALTYNQFDVRPAFYLSPNIQVVDTVVDTDSSYPDNGSTAAPNDEDVKLLLVTGLKAETASAHEVSLSWSAVEQASSYAVQRYVKKENEWVKSRGRRSAKTTAYTDSRVDPNTAYKYAVYAVNKGDYHLYTTAELEVTTKELAKVTGTKATASTGAVTLTWGPYEGADKYKIYRYYKNDAGEWKKNSAARIEETTYTDEKKVEAGTDYKYEVQPIIGRKIYKDASGEVLVSTEALPVLKGLKATSSVDTVELTWSAYEGADTYKLYRYYKNSDGKWKKNRMVRVEANQYTDDKKLEEVTEYKYEVYPIINKKMHDTTGAETLVKTPERPHLTGLKGTVSADAVSLSWAAYTGADQYKVDRYMKNSKGEWKRNRTTRVEEPTYTDEKKLRAGTEYKYEVYPVIERKTYTSAVAEIMILTSNNPVAAETATMEEN